VEARGSVKAKTPHEAEFLVARPGLSRPAFGEVGLIHPAFALPKRLTTASRSRRFRLSALASQLAPLPNKNAPRYRVRRLLPDLDSNQDKLNQNQLYCHYTIGQFPIGDAKVGSEAIPANFLLGFLG
jgi:hypothetical protein